MNKYIVEVAARVTNAIFIEAFEVEADSEEDARELVCDGEGLLLSSFISDEGETMSEEIISCYEKIKRTGLAK